MLDHAEIKRQVATAFLAATKVVLAWWGALLIVLISANQDTWITLYLVELLTKSGEGGDNIGWQGAIGIFSGLCAMMFSLSALAYFWTPPSESAKLSELILPSIPFSISALALLKVLVLFILPYIGVIPSIVLTILK